MPNVASFSARFTDLCRRHSVSITGTDGPVMVLQHGFGTDLSVWEKLLPALESHFCVVRMNLAGSGVNGAATFDPARYSHIESHADDLLQVLHDLDVDECFYVGASVGSTVGLLAAIERPRLFRKIVVIGCSPHYLNDGDYLGGFEQEQLDTLYNSMSNDYSGWIAGFAPLVVRGLPGSEAVREFSESLSSLRPDVALLTARTIFQSDFRNQLPLVQPPVVLLQMENDFVVPLHVCKYMEARIPNATLEMLPVEGHFPHLAAPSVVSEALLRYLL